MEEAGLLTTPMAARRLGITRQRVLQLIAEGHLEAAGRAGRVVLLRRADVERLAREGWPGRRQRPDH
jgi:excisionase family DNA binding protein